MDRIEQGVINEILHIAGIIYRILIWPTIILGFMCIPIYYFYLSIVCQNAWFIPFIHNYCPGREINILSYLPLDDLTENTMSLAETLSNADVSAPMHCVQAKIAFIEIRAEIIHSDIKREIKNNLAEIILDLQKLMDKGAEQSSKSSNMKTTDLASQAFNDYTDIINKQIDNVLFKAQEFHTTLDLITGKIETIQGLAKEGKQISDLELDELLKDSFWTWIFGKDVVNIRKHQRNIKKLNEFNNFIRKLSNDTSNIIKNLLRFKSSATNLKETAAELHTLQYKSPERQLQIIKASLNRLAQAKQAFEKKMEQENREKYLT